MAQKVNVVILSDLSEKEGASPLSFGLDGNLYEIDLTDDEAGKLRDVLAKYVGAARRIKSAPVKKASAGNAGYNPAEVREWAKAQGLDVPDRGRIPADMITKYQSRKG